MPLVASCIDASSTPAFPRKLSSDDGEADLHSPALPRIGAAGRGNERAPLSFQGFERAGRLSGPGSLIVDDRGQVAFAVQLRGACLLVRHPDTSERVLGSRGLALGKAFELKGESAEPSTLVSAAVTQPNPNLARSASGVRRSRQKLARPVARISCSGFVVSERAGSGEGQGLSHGQGRLPVEEDHSDQTRRTYKQGHSNET